MIERASAVLWRSIRQSRYWSLVVSLVIVWTAAGCVAPTLDQPAQPVDANADGTVSTVAGVGEAGFSGDGGPASAAMLNVPSDVTTLDDGTLLIADAMNHRVRAVDIDTGRISTVAGNGETTGAAALNMPVGVTASPDGGFYVADWADHFMYAFDLGGARTTLIGTGDFACDVIDGPASEASLYAPRSADVMADGSVLVSEQGCHRVVRVNTQGEVSIYAGNAMPGYSGDEGPADEASLQAGSLEGGPSLGISLSPEDPPDELYIADTENHVIRQVKVFSRRIVTFAGTGEPGFRDGPPDEAQFNRPTHVFTDRDHAVWVVDSGNHAIRFIDPLGTRVTTVVGTGSPGFNGDGLAPAETQLSDPRAVWLDRTGRVFIADTGNQRIRLFRSR